MAAAKTLGSDRNSRLTTAARPWWCETDHCRKPGVSYGRRTRSLKSPETPGMPHRISCLPQYKSARRSCSRRLHRPPSSRSGLGLELRVVGPPEPTSAQARDGGGFPFRPGRSALRQHRRGPLFFERAQLSSSLLVGYLVPLPFHRVFGTLIRELLLTHDPPQLVVAETDACLLLQMGAQPGQRPHAETVTKFLGWRLDGGPQRCEVLGRGARGPTRRLSGNQPGQASQSIGFAYVVDGPDAATQIVSDRRFGATRRAHQYDRRVAKDSGLRGGEPQVVHGVPFLVGKLPCHRCRLHVVEEIQPLAWSLPSTMSPLKTFCGTT